MGGKDGKRGYVETLYFRSISYKPKIALKNKVYL